MHHVLIYFHNYLKSKTMIFNFSKMEGAPQPREPKALFKTKKIKLYRFDIVYVDILFYSLRFKI
jgi:hypothetical protein